MTPDELAELIEWQLMGAGQVAEAERRGSVVDVAGWDWASLDRQRFRVRVELLEAVDE